MINRIDETIEMKNLPMWLQELWEQNPSLARRAEKHYLELKEQCSITDVVGRSEQLFCYPCQAWTKHKKETEKSYRCAMCGNMKAN